MSEIQAPSSSGPASSTRSSQQELMTPMDNPELAARAGSHQTQFAARLAAVTLAAGTQTTGASSSSHPLTEGPGNLTQEPVPDGTTPMNTLTGPSTYPSNQEFVTPKSGSELSASQLQLPAATTRQEQQLPMGQLTTQTANIAGGTSQGTATIAAYVADQLKTISPTQLTSFANFLYVIQGMSSSPGDQVTRSLRSGQHTKVTPPSEENDSESHKNSATSPAGTVHQSFSGSGSHHSSLNSTPSMPL